MKNFGSNCRENVIFFSSASSTDARLYRPFHPVWSQGTHVWGPGTLTREMHQWRRPCRRQKSYLWSQWLIVTLIWYDYVSSSCYTCFFSQGFVSCSLVMQTRNISTFKKKLTKIWSLSNTFCWILVYQFRFWISAGKIVSFWY